MAIARNELTVVERVVGNLEPLGATLTDIDGTPVNVTGKSVKFRQVLMSEPYTVAVDDADAGIVDGAAGKVGYNFNAGETDVPGSYACYFWIDESGIADKLFPYDGAQLQLHIKRETQS